MKQTQRFALLAAVAALALGANAYAAKEIKIAANNSGYSADDAQKLASTAVSMGVKEPVNLSLAGGNLTARRGKVQGMESRQNVQVIDAVCPLSEMFGYATDLRSRTQGRGTFTMQFSHYDEVPRSIAESVVGKNNYRL